MMNAGFQTPALPCKGNIFWICDGKPPSSRMGAVVQTHWGQKTRKTFWELRLQEPWTGNIQLTDCVNNWMTITVIPI